MQIMGDNRVQLDSTIKALQAENASLLEQLHCIQEELEQYALGRMAHQQTAAAVRSNPDADTTYGAGHPARRRRTAPWEGPTALQVERRARKDAQRRRDAILKSTSWRLTAPLRWLRHPLSGRAAALPQPSAHEPTTLDEERNARRRLETEIRALLSSTSWRVTAPIRSLRMNSGVVEREMEELRAARERLEAENAHLRTENEHSHWELLRHQRAAADTKVDHLRQQLSALENELSEQRTTQAGHAAQQRELEEQAASLTSDLAGARADLSIAIRVNAQRELDLTELQSRYAESIKIRDQQHALLLKLRQRLGEAATYLQQLDQEADKPELVGELLGVLGAERPGLDVVTEGEDARAAAGNPASRPAAF